MLEAKSEVGNEIAPSFFVIQVPQLKRRGGRRGGGGGEGVNFLIRYLRTLTFCLSV